MKAQKWLTLLLSGAMALSVGAMAACKKEKEPDKPTPTPPVGGDYTVDTTEYYIVGGGEGSVKENGWSNTNHVLAMKRDESADHNVFSITLNIYADDAFQIVHDDSWDGQMGISFFLDVTEEGADAFGDSCKGVVKNADGEVVFYGGGMFGSDITLQKGHDGVYTISLHTFPDSDKESYITYTKDSELSALLDMYVVSDMNDFGFNQTKYEADHMVKRSDNVWKKRVEIKDSDLKRDADGNKVTTGGQYAAIAVRNNVPDAEGYHEVTCDGNRTPVAVIEGDKYNLLPAGAYTFYYDPAKKTLTIEDGATEIYFIGDFSDWKLDKKYILNEGDDDNWTGYFHVDADKTAELKLRNPYYEGNDGWFPKDNIKLTAGDYFFKYTTKTRTVEYEQLSYYIIGSVPNEDGEADDNYNFKLTEVSAIPLEEVEKGVFGCTEYIPDCSTAYDWVKPNIFAFKVVYGTYLGGARDWFGAADGGNVTIPEVGEYKVTFNTSTNAIDVVRTVKKVTFDMNYENATGAPAVQNVDSYKTATAPADPTRTDYTFYGWYEDAECTVKYDFNSLVTEDITLYARWVKTSEIPASVKVTFDLNYEGAPTATQADTVKGLVAQPADPAREGYYFKGWYDKASEGSLFNFDALVSQATTVYAYWIEVDNHVYHIVGKLKSGAIKDWDPSDETLALERDTSYTNANVFTITVTLFAGDQFKIKGITVWNPEDGSGPYEVNADHLRGDDSFVSDWGNIKATVDGVYTLTFFRDTWELYYKVKPIVSADEVYPKVNGVEGDKFSKDGDNWYGYVTVSAGDTVKLVNKADYNEYDVNITAAGEYFVKLNLKDGTVDFELCEYYLVGSFTNEAGEADDANFNFKLNDKASFKLVATETANVYTVVVDFKDVSGAYDWVKPGVFALKIVYGTKLGGARDWYGDGDNNVLVPSAGKYTVSYNSETHAITLTPVTE